MNKTTRRAIPIMVLLSLVLPGVSVTAPIKDSTIAIKSDSKEETFNVADNMILTYTTKESIMTIHKEPQVPIKPISRGVNVDVNTYNTFKVTAYDLSHNDCGKHPWEKDYGITATGLSIKGKDIRDRYIAVDPRIIPYNSKVFMVFPREMNLVKTLDGEEVNLNGIYTAVDTGGAIKGYRIDLFMGEDTKEDYYKKLVLDFGVRRVKVYKLGENDND